MQNKKLFIRRMYATLAGRYDRANRIISLGQDRRWRRRVVIHLPRAGRIVDLGGGTGDLTEAYCESGPETAQVIIVDFSREMMACARGKFSGRPWRDQVAFVLADVERLPFKTGTFDGAMSSFVLRNLPGIGPVARETARVLRPGATGVFLDATRPAAGWWHSVYDLYFQRIMPRMAAMIHRDQGTAYRYLAGSVLVFPSAGEIAQVFVEAGFAGCRCLPLWGGVATIFMPHTAPSNTPVPET
jgi:demethylmenaquinone methyltransferase/2-methoxy-6-polyprenyl-1,4-benzoquinol methylase